VQPQSAVTSKWDAQSNRLRTSSRWWMPAAIGIVVAVLYADVLKLLAEDWWENESYSHGLLVVPLALYIAWKQRAVILSAPKAPSAKGIVLTAIACMTYLAGKLGAEFFVTRVSFLLLLCGIIWTGWGAARLRQLTFPLLLIASVIPLPVIVYNSLAAPLQLLASRLATSLAQQLGVSVFRDGNIIQLANTSLGVAEACSGLRSLGPLAVGALLLGYLKFHRFGPKLVVFLLSIPIAIFFNVMRVTGTALLAEHDPELAMGFYHLLSGWLVFVAGFGTLYVCAGVVERFLPRQREGLPS
jgi:exosortase